MKFAFRSGWGESLALARRVEAEGNLVRFSIVEPTAQLVGQGLITKTKDWPAAVSWADVVVFDSNPFEMPTEAERARRTGKNVVGSSEFAGQLEHDRMMAIDLAQKAGVEVPHYFRFNGRGAWQKARQFLGEHGDDDPDGWVWKHNGDSETASTFVGSAEEMLRMLNYFEGLYAAEKETPDFILTTKIEGIEVSTEAWFDGERFFLANTTIERNKFFPGDLGEKTGCAGNVVWVYRDVDECPLFKHLLAPLAATLRGKYRGPIDVNALIEEETNEPIFLEFTPRFGYDAVFALAHLVSDDLAGLLADTSMGRTWRGHFVHDQFAGALRLHTAPYPGEEEGRAENIPIFGFDPAKVEKAVSPGEVMLDGMGEAVTSGPNGAVFVLSALGSTPSEAMRACEPEEIKVPQMRYRTDLPQAIQKVYDELLETGWVTGPQQKRRLFGR